MNSVGLVLEGGGMKGVYTAGVLDFFMDNGLYFPYVVGVSAGACNALSYISKQRGRNRIVTIDFVSDPRYLSFRNLLKERSIFGMNFIFQEIPEKIVPFDFAAFAQNQQQLVVGATDCDTGQPIYFAKSSGADMLLATRASSSLPFVSRPVVMDGHTLLDGGLADPIPVRKSMQDGNRKHVIVMTKTKDYRKHPYRLGWAARRAYKRYPRFVETLMKRPQHYNGTLEFIHDLETSGEAFVIQPSVDLHISRIEKNTGKLGRLYELGYEDAKRLYEPMHRFLH